MMVPVTPEEREEDMRVVRTFFYYISLGIGVLVPFVYLIVRMAKIWQGLNQTTPTLWQKLNQPAPTLWQKLNQPTLWQGLNQATPKLWQKLNQTTPTQW
ncbi:hypothetical protein GGS20DRAFT_584116 [Poronia punctata]|nr:hypothetical protein GGS20DRAFT_584116 [Poronia punctata]